MLGKKQRIEDKIAAAPVFNPDPAVGLSEEQVQQRKEDGLTNKTKKHVGKSYGKIVFDNVFNYLNLVLFAVFVAMLFAKLPFSNYLFMVILLANITIGLIQDIHARHLIDKLRLVSDPKAKIIRDGKTLVVDVGEVVLGDILLLEAGDQIAADGTVVLGQASVDESLLSGESEAVDKDVGDPIWSGTYLKKGTVRIKVEKIGAANYIETLQAEARKVSRPKSEIKRSINMIMTVCCSSAIVIGAVMLISWLIRSSNAGTLGDPDNYSSFIASLSGSMVAMLPAGMFLLTSLTLAVGVIQLAKRRMLVQQLYCIEMLARVDVLCLDKTGTLTDGTMAVHAVETVNDAQSAEIALMISAILHFTGDKNATAVAMRNRFGQYTGKQASRVIPFDSEVKYSAVTIADEGTFCFGAFGFVPAKPNAKIAKLVKKYSSEGYRCLVVARSDESIHKGACPKDMDYVGLVVLSDHLKEDAKKNIAWFQDNGVAVRVISGDDPLTVSQIAVKAGVRNAEKYVSLLGKSLGETAQLANEYAVFGRVSPEQKAVLIKEYQSHGHKVAMTGDGVNDILALRTADCSIAMASGADAAKNVSHLVSLDSDFSKLPDVVAQGRRVINNLQRTCSLFLAKTLFALIVSTFFLFSIAFGGHRYPFTTANMLPWEMFTIGIAAFFLALQPSNERLEGSFMENILLRCLPAGVVCALAGLLPFLISRIWPSSYCYEMPWENATTMAVILFTFVSYVVLFRISWPPNKYRLVVFFGAAALGIAAFTADFFLRGGKGALIQLNWNGLTWSFALIALALTALLMGAYLGFDFIGDKLRSRYERRRKSNNEK